MEHKRPNDLNGRRSANQRTDEHNGGYQPLRELRRREPRIVLPHHDTRATRPRGQCRHRHRRPKADAARASAAAVVILQQHGHSLLAAVTSGRVQRAARRSIVVEVIASLDAALGTPPSPPVAPSRFSSVPSRLSASVPEEPSTTTGAGPSSSSSRLPKAPTLGRRNRVPRPSKILLASSRAAPPERPCRIQSRPNRKSRQRSRRTSPRRHRWPRCRRARTMAATGDRTRGTRRPPGAANHLAAAEFGLVGRRRRTRPPLNSRRLSGFI